MVKKRMQHMNTKSRKYSSRLLALLGFLITLPGTVFACDPCALYNASLLQGHEQGAFTFGLSEQYTSFDRAATIQANDRRDGEFVRGYSTTQLSGTYDFSPRFGVQITVPFIGRNVDTLRDYREYDTQDGGLGDVSIVGNYALINKRSKDSQFLFSLTAGAKLATGDTGDLEPVVAEEEAADHIFLRHHSIGASSGGRALTEGTGSYDAIFGAGFLARKYRWLLLGHSQYTLRTEGDFDYEFADDFLWSIAPGRYLYLQDTFSVAAALAFSGEYKAEDELAGEEVTGSKISNLYLGPQLLMTLSQKTSMEFTWDFRTTGEDKDSTVVPDQRIRASLAYRF
jgi:hypothetical protein